MRSLFQSISNFFQRLLRPFNTRTGSKHKQAQTTAQTGARLLIDHPQSAALRRLIYQATYDLPRTKRTHAAQVGALLRQQDQDFSYEKYRFTKLIDLLEAVPDLIELEKEDPNPNNPSSAPVYYVRPVTDTKRLLIDTLKGYRSSNGWVHLDSLLEAMLQKPGYANAQKAPVFSPQRYGYGSFQSFIESRSDLIEFKEGSPQYVRLASQQRPRIVTKPKRVVRKPRAPSGNSNSNGNGDRTRPISLSTTKRRTIVSLVQFTGFSMEQLHDKVSELAAIALPENWYFGPTPPADFAYPILKSYLRYTFIRLQYEDKLIAISAPSNDQAKAQYQAFNTGLLDTLLRPIYGLFTRTHQPENPWALDFCIAGEGPAGKTLVAQFSQLPLAANYLENADKAFYHLSSGAPQVDWQHVVKDNMARLPLAFLERNAPTGFTPRSTKGLTTPEFFEYKHAFIAALEADPASYRQIVNKLEEALERTLRRIQINYTTAIPTYYPKINSIDLLLPLCLVDENTADLALVVRHEPSGKYIGHTVLTMRQAYNNARLICKRDEHWLIRSLAISQNSFDDETDEDDFDSDS